MSFDDIDDPEFCVDSARIEDGIYSMAGWVELPCPRRRSTSGRYAIEVNDIRIPFSAS
ncbi:hypothetical protein [Cryobacterium sp. MLB-32]|uniref:hypothetical protein n=1 Tax=Cryobacterium sp. MLB-32 TaxID=1529318 RepID=UPI001E53F2F3|nr:hypothetical protein [Cryobacterium sp. MLB-32]